jgi:signal transduction histidine kinase
MQHKDPKSKVILASLCDSLLHLLDLRFVFGRLHPTARRSAPIDHLSIAKRWRARTGRTHLPVALEPWLTGHSSPDSSPGHVRLGAETVMVTALSFRSKIIPGTLILGAPSRKLSTKVQSGSDVIGLAHASRVLSLGELTASLAHEINQPLTAIVTHADAARRWLERTPPEYDRARAALDNIARDGNRASAILQRVRAFSTKAEPSRQPVKINDVIREVVSFITYEVSREQVSLKTELAEGLPEVNADHIELQQVVLNLVINSIEALRPVVDRPRNLSITSARHNRTTIEVSVRDNGNGIDTQHLEQMFEPFFTTKSSGMGLGLAISRRIIEAHQGSLRARTNPKWGLTLAFTLPVRRKRMS